MELHLFGQVHASLPGVGHPTLLEVQIQISCGALTHALPPSQRRNRYGQTGDSRQFGLQMQLEAAGRKLQRRCHFTL